MTASLVLGQLEAMGVTGYVPAGEAAERLSSRIETQNFLTGEAQQLSEQMTRVLQQQVPATEELAEANEEAADSTESLAAEQAKLTQIVRQSTDAQLTAAGELFTAYDDLAVAQGEYVTVYSDNSSEIAEIQAQLMADLSDEQKEGLQAQLDELNEFSPEAIAIWNQLQGDITESQRRSLISQLADLQGAHGEMQSVYTGDAVAAEEAQERINTAMGEIAAGYQNMTLKIIEAKLVEKFGEDSAVIELALIGVREQMGLISPAQAELERNLIQSGETLKRSLSVVLDGFLEDNHLSQYEMGILATITETASNDMQGSLGEMGGAVTTATETVIGLKDEAQEFVDGGPYEPTVDVDDQASAGLTTIQEHLRELKDKTITVTTIYQEQGQPAGGGATGGGAGNLPGPETPGASSGGLIRGGIANRDSVLMRLMPGEYVLQKSAVERLGIDTLHQLNSGAPSGALAMSPGRGIMSAGYVRPQVSFQSNDKLLFIVNDKGSAALAASLASQQRKKAVMDALGY